MPVKQDDQFVDAVKPALESLLSDLQRTTEVLRRAQQRNSQDREFSDVNTSMYSSSSYKDNRRSYDNDIDPIYQEQNVVMRNSQQSNDEYGTGNRNRRSGSGYGNNDTSNNRRSTDNRGSRETSQLNSMLGDLQVDMDKHGIHTIPKGDCAACEKQIIGQVVIALGKMWHPEHYVCCHCGDQIGHKNFFERGGKAYCENDYHDLYSPRCAYCNGPIKDRCITAIGKTFHPEHFTCADCGKQFGEEGFHEKDGVAYCRDDFFRMFAPKCHGCDKPIKNKFITALGTHWHPDCFICQECHRSFAGGAFFEHDGAPFCEQHFHQQRGSLCNECKKPISGRCVSAMGNKFHPEHFVCTYCSKELTRGTFKEANKRPYCHKCYGKINNP
uniref:LIM zinc-binding domain-containing protein n=1 Tax=Panagrolaimus sp. ES5 TaxID=591445 RepID=A0AC34FL83_9BILA